MSFFVIFMWLLNKNPNFAQKNYHSTIKTIDDKKKIWEKKHGRKELSIINVKKHKLTRESMKSDTNLSKNETGLINK